MSGSIHLSTGTRNAKEETASSRVGMHSKNDRGTRTDAVRIMSNQVMPLTQALEGYDLFDQRKVLKGKW